MRTFITLLCLLTLPWYAHGSTIEVCATCDVASIKEAIAQAENGDIVHVGKGLYTEGQITIDKEITLQGEKGAILDGKHESEILTIVADNVTIRGFTIRNVGTSYTKDRAGIKVESKKNILIEKNRLIDTFFGIYLAHSVRCIVRDNVIIGTAVQEFSAGNAIHVWYSDGIEIYNNTCITHRDGIYLEFVENCKIAGNTCRGNVRYGMHFMFSDHNEFMDNHFTDNGAGVAVMFSNFITMNDNIFEHNWGSSSYGVLLKEIKDSEIKNNEFNSNTIALYAEGSNRNIIEHNSFSQNGWALKIMGNCDDNKLLKNNFFSNTFEMATNAKKNTNHFEGNYWSEYAGYDLDHDNVGDVPHGPISLFSYVVENNPPTIMLLRSFFVDLLNFAEKTTPVLTPSNIVDAKPAMTPIQQP